MSIESQYAALKTRTPHGLLRPGKFWPKFVYQLDGSIVMFTEQSTYVLGRTSLWFEQ